MSKIYIVMYHYVRDLGNSRYPSIKGLDYELFKNQIDYFSNNFHVITMEQVIDFYRGGYKGKDKKKYFPEHSLLLTFDDGYIDDYTFVLPILKKYHMQGSFFVPGKVFTEHCLLDVNKIHFLLAKVPIDILFNELLKQMDEYRGGQWKYSSNQELYKMYALSNRFDDEKTVFFKRILQVGLPERLRNIICTNLYRKYIEVPEEVLAREIYLSYDQMIFMKQSGMFFGIHGFEHSWMNRLQEEDLKKDLRKSLACMRDLIDENCWVINYPYGSYSREVINSLQDIGCVCGLSTDLGIADLDADNRFTLPRLDTNDFPPKSNHYKDFEF